MNTIGVGTVVSTEARVRTELLLYQESVGCPLCDELGNYVCPLT